MAHLQWNDPCISQFSKLRVIKISSMLFCHVQIIHLLNQIINKVYMKTY